MKKLTSIFLYIACMCAPMRSLMAQSTASGATVAVQGISWWNPNVTLRLSDRFSYMAELNLRTANFMSTWQQIQFRTAVNYHLNSAVTFSLGYSFIESYPYGKFPAGMEFPEHRIYEQVQFTQNIGRVILQHRARLEQRFVGHIGKNDDNENIIDRFYYTNRMRYMVRITVPLNKPTLIKNTVFVTAYDEIFINFLSTAVRANLFDQNRISASIGYQFTSSLSAQIGYMFQFIEKSDGARFESNHGPLVTLTFNPDLRSFFKKQGS